MEFWRPLAYIPNLAYGKGKADDTESIDKVRDEHTCLKAVLNQLCILNRKGGVEMTVLGKEVNIRMFILVIIGDTQGNNTWLAHYNGSGRLSRPYRDCECEYDDMDDPNPDCCYVTLDSMRYV